MIGLHFTDESLGCLRVEGVETAEVTLYIGTGTLQPVCVDRIEEHETYSEWFNTPAEIVVAAETVKARGNGMWAVGITSMYVLKSVACETDHPEAGRGDTDISVMPGYRLNVADRSIANFHLSKSALLMLASVFSDMEHARSIYRHAVEQEYRFFSYGDAMILGETE